MTALVVWLQSQMLATLRVMRELQLLVHLMGVDWSYLFLQTGTGEVMLSPPPVLSDYVYIMSNAPSGAYIKRMIENQRRRTWQACHMIKLRMGTEKRLRALFEKLPR